MYDTLHHTRQFLNPKEGMAAIEAHIGAYKDEPHIEGFIAISDCARKVELDFNVYGCNSTEGYDARVAKLDVLIETLTRFRSIYMEHRPKFEKLLAKAEAEALQEAA